MSKDKNLHRLCASIFWQVLKTPLHERDERILHLLKKGYEERGGSFENLYTILKDELQRHNYLYHTLCEPEISDGDYDAMFACFEALERVEKNE